MLNKKITLLFAMIFLFAILPNISAFSESKFDFDYPQTNTVGNTNYSENSGMLEERNTATLYDYFKSLFDNIYCKLTGCTMSGNIVSSANITANTFFGDGSQLTGISSGSPTFLNSTHMSINLTSGVIQWQ